MDKETHKQKTVLRVSLSIVVLGALMTFFTLIAGFSPELLNKNYWLTTQLVLDRKSVV